MEKRVYTSQNSYSIFGIIKSSLNGYNSSFYLAKQLAIRDIKAQYRQSLLGVFWAILPILINSLVWIFLQSTGTVKLAETGIPYVLYVVVGTTIWSIIGESINLPILTINANKSIISKVNFDKEGLVTLGVLKFIFDLMIKFFIIIIFIIYFKVSLNGLVFLFFPLLFITILSLIAIGKILTPIGVLYNDVGRSIPIILQFLMYITPVIYVMPNEGFMAEIMRYNPLSYIVVDLRNCLTGGLIQFPLFWVLFLFLAIGLFFISMVVFRISMPIIAEKMN